MFYTLIILTLIIGNLSSVSFKRQNQNVHFDFARMIEKLTNHSAWDYLKYGCYCDLGGTGTPVDAIDKCCAIHDQCYDNITNYSPIAEVCSPYMISYTWYIHDNNIICLASNSICKLETCQCDKSAIECFLANKFNEQYKDYNQNLC